MELEFPTCQNLSEADANRQLTEANRPSWGSMGGDCGRLVSLHSLPPMPATAASAVAAAGEVETRGDPRPSVAARHPCQAIEGVHAGLRAAVERCARAFKGDLYVAPEIPAGRLANALRSFEIPADECVHAIIDCSILGNARTGAVIGCRNIYMRNGILAGAQRGLRVVPHPALRTDLAVDRNGRIWWNKELTRCLDISAVRPAYQSMIAELLSECGEIVRGLARSRDYMRCPHCQQEIRRLQLANHLASCDAQLLPCKFCGEAVPKGRLAAHEAKCPGDVVPCRHCGKPFQAEAVASHELLCDPEARGRDGYLSWGCPFCDRPPAEVTTIREGLAFTCCGTRWTVGNMDRGSRTIYLEDNSNLNPDGSRDGYLISDCPQCTGRHSRCRFPICHSEAQVVSHCRKCGHTEVYGFGVSIEKTLEPYFGGNRPFGRRDKYGVDFTF